MRREVRAMCDRGTASCYINPCPGIFFSRSGVIRTKSSVVVGSVPSISVCFVVIQFSHGKSQLLSSTESRQGYPVKSWKTLPLEQAARRLEALGLHLNQPEQALICTRCKYALKPSGETVSKHLWEKHQISPEERHGLSVYVKDLYLTDEVLSWYIGNEAQSLLLNGFDKLTINRCAP
jgi:hypothetical protein